MYNFLLRICMTAGSQGMPSYMLFFPLKIKALFTSHPNPKYFLFHPSHQIFRRMHEVLNVGKKDN
jgi:hypothetical protein